MSAAENFYNILNKTALKAPEQCALVDDTGALTYGELFQKVETLKRRLLNFGLEAGHGLGIFTGNNRHFVIALLAGLGAGAVVMPISYQLKGEEREKCLKEADLHVLLFERKLLSAIECPVVENPLGDAELEFQRLRAPTDGPLVPHIKNAAVIRYTSGTTGKAKGVVLSHRSIDERTLAVQKGFNLSTQDRIIWVLPMAYHFIVSILFYLRYGATLCICPDLLAQTILDYTEKHQGTLLYAAPLHYQLLLATSTPEKLQSLKWAISTSIGLPPEIGEEFAQKFSLPIIQAFGNIEVGLPIVNFSAAKMHPGAIGHPLPDYEVAIFGAHNQPLPADEMGKLAIKGPGFFDGYLSPKKLREHFLHDGWFLTGDLAAKSVDGLITIKGREKSVINVGGNKVFPEEVENILNLHPKIAASRVYAEKHPLMGEVVYAEILLRPRQKTEDEELRSYCAQHLSIYKIPQKFYAKDSLPTTASGKVLRN